MTLAIIMLLIGALLVWAGVTGRDPREELVAAFRGKR